MKYSSKGINTRYQRSISRKNRADVGQKMPVPFDNENAIILTCAAPESQPGMNDGEAFRKII